MKISSIKSKRHLTLPFTTFTNFLTMITIIMTIIRVTAMKFLTTLWEKLISISSTRQYRWLGHNLNTPAIVVIIHLTPATVFFSHLRLNCWKSNANDKFFHEKITAMVTNETLPPNVKLLPMIIFSATAVENTGYAFKNWHYAVLQIHWSLTVSNRLIFMQTRVVRCL